MKATWTARPSTQSLRPSESESEPEGDEGADVFSDGWPLGLAAGPNPYRYCDNDPVNDIDPTGLQTVSIYVQQTGMPANFFPGQVQKAINGILAKSGVKANVIIFTTTRDPDKGDFDAKADKLGIAAGIGDHSNASLYCHFVSPAKGGFPGQNNLSTRIVINIPALNQQVATVADAKPDWNILYANFLIHEGFWGDLLGNADDAKAAAHSLGSSDQSINSPINLSPQDVAAINSKLP